MPLFDTHAHYNINPLFNNWQTHWQKAQSMGVTKTVIVGSNLNDCDLAVQICKDQENLYPALGLHPEIISIDQVANPDYQATINQQISKLTQIVSDDKSRVIAIGEIGLDYYWLKSDDQNLLSRAKEIQIDLFKTQLELALQHQMPIIIHCRDKNIPEIKTQGNAYWDLLEILKASSIIHQPLSFVLHCASGPINFIKQAINLGAYVGFDGNITYPSADHIRHIFEITPHDKRLIETDAPFLPPQEYRGKTCEPWMITLTAKYVGEKFDQNLDQLYQNSMAFFNLKIDQ